MPVCGNYLFFELPKKIVLNPKDGHLMAFIGKSDDNIWKLYKKKYNRV